VLSPPFQRSVFVNCPFDEEFSPILQAIAFCIAELGFYPRLAPENADNAANRLDRILELIRGSKYSIHDLSRCKSRGVGEFSRLNMPFELGIDFGCKRFSEGTCEAKTMLILEETRWDYQKSLSDIAGWDIHSHDGDHIKAVKRVRDWLVRQEGAAQVGSTKILDSYADFQGWYWDRELGRGASDDDIREYPTIQVVEAMIEWVNLGRPS